MEKRYSPLVRTFIYLHLIIAFTLIGCKVEESPIHFEQAADIATVCPESDKKGREKPDTSMELAGHGVAVIDANLDGRLDLAFVNGQPYYFVALNNGEENGKLQFDTKTVYIGKQSDNLTNEPRSIHSHDFNNDGALDLYLCNTGKGTLKAKQWKDLTKIHAPENLIDRGLFRDSKYRTQLSKKNGIFKYKDFGADGDGNTRGSLFADFDGDGHFDCFLNNSAYFGVWHVSSSAPNRIYAGKKDGFGPDILESVVVGAPPERFKDKYGRATKCFKGTVTRDFDGDGRPDIIANAISDPEGDPAGGEIDLDKDGIPDGGHQRTWGSGTLVLHNISEPGKIQFRDVSIAAIDNTIGSERPMRAHTTIPADIDGDGDLDLLMGGSPYLPSPARVYRNDSKPGEIRFTNITEEAGLGFLSDLEQLPPAFKNGNLEFDAKTSLTPRMCTGVVADIDNDGDVDWVTANRTPFRRSKTPIPMLIFINDGKGHFTLLPSEVHGLVTTSRDLSYGDFNNDGLIDIVTVSGNGGRHGDDFHNKNLVFLNRVKNGNHYIEIDVTSKDNRLGLGTKVTIYKAGTDQILGHDEVRTDFAYRSSRAPRLHFGLGKVRKIDIRYQRRNGDTGVQKNVKADQIYKLKMQAM